MTSENSDNQLYQKTAQKLLDYDADMIGEYGTGEPDAVHLAQQLYKIHGPFELDWHTWARDVEEWYDE